MGALDLNRVAISMGKVFKLLSELEPKIRTGDDVYEHKEDFCVIAYICRVGILDRIEQSSWMRQEVPIKIPTGIFSFKQETISSGLMLTIGKLKEITSLDVVTEHYIEDILNHRGAFYKYEDILPLKFKNSI
jgi:hypothetical protein